MKFYSIPSRTRQDFVVAERNLVSFRGADYPHLLMKAEGEAFVLAGAVADWLDAAPGVKIEVNAGAVGDAEPTVFLDFPCQATAEAFLAHWA